MRFQFGLTNHFEEIFWDMIYKNLPLKHFFDTLFQEGDDLDNIQWLTLDNIGESDDHGGRLPGPAGLVGSGRAVGGVITKMVGVTDSPGEGGIQLQRIVSRCKAEFFYVSYGDTELESVETGGKHQGRYFIITMKNEICSLFILIRCFNMKTILNLELSINTFTRNNKSKSRRSMVRTGNSSECFLICAP